MLDSMVLMRRRWSGHRNRYGYTKPLDVAAHADNVRLIVDMVGEADVLFMEATFLHADAAEAERKHRLTARAAGEIARRARVKRIVPFHFSPRYAGREAELRAEVEAAFTASDG